MGVNLLLHALRRPACCFTGGEPSPAPAGRVQNLVPGVHEQQGQEVRRMRRRVQEKPRGGQQRGVALFSLCMACKKYISAWEEDGLWKARRTQEPHSDTNV